MAGNGPAADSSGNIYLATGNGTFDVDGGPLPNNDHGDSIVKLGSPSGGTFPVISYFTPLNQLSPEAADAEQGPGGVLLLPDITVSSGTQSFLIQAGKDGNIYLADRSNLGGFNSAISGQIPGGIWGSPTYWNGSFYFADAADGASTGGPIHAFSLNAGGSGLISNFDTSRSAQTFGFPAPTSSIASSGTISGGCPSSCQVLYAFDATNLATQLYSSSQTAGGGDQDGGAVKSTVPTVANGKVYAGGKNSLTVYGLLP